MVSEKQNRKQGTMAEATPQESFLQQNLKKIGICVAIVLLIIVAVLLYNNYAQRQGEKAALALYPCEQLFQAGNYDKALNGDGQEVIGLLEVAKQYGRTPSGNLARLYAGLAYAKTGKYQEAEQYLSKFDAQDDAMVSPAALGALGNVYAELGQTDKAIATLTKAAERADNAVLSPIFLVQAGELLESQDKADEALKLYEQVRANYRGSMQGSEVDKYIERIKATK